MRKLERLARRVRHVGRTLLGEKDDSKRDFLEILFANHVLDGPLAPLYRSSGLFFTSADQPDALGRGAAILFLAYLDIM